VEFFYEARTDKQIAYIAGKPTGQSVLLKRIKTSSANTTFREYKINYFDDGFSSKLTEVEEYGQTGIRYNSTIVNWGDYNGSYAKNGHEYSASISPNRDVNFPVYADFNGDGKTDFISYPKKSSYSSSDVASLYLAHNTSGNVEFSKQATIPLIAGFEDIIPADLDGDGLMDVVRIHKVSNNNYRFDYFMYNGISFTSSGYGFNSSSKEAFPGDFNGDGKYEILAKSETKLYNQYGSAIATGGIAWGTLLFDDLSPFYRQVIDFNGNGKTDMYVADNNGYRIYELNGSSFTQLCSGSEIKNLAMPLFGDFNGDGKTDMLVCLSNNAEYFMLFSTGTGFVKKTLPNLNITGKTFVFDFNRDGKADIVHCAQNNGYAFPLRVGLFDGENFHFENYTSNLITSSNMDMTLSWQYLHFSDFDGDGFPELCFARYNSSSIIKSFNSKQNLLVRGITDGLNRKTEFTYLPMTNLSVCNENGTSVFFPETKNRVPLYLVSSMSTNAAGVSSTNTFKYWNPRTHRQGKGFLGFKKVEMANEDQNRKIVTDYDYDDILYYYVYPKQQKVTNYSGNTDISTVTFTYDYFSFGGTKRIFPYVEQQTVTDHIKSLSVTTNYQYINSDDGNPWKITETRGDLATVTTFTWQAKGSPFKNRVTNSVITRSGLQGTFTHTTAMNYDNNGRLTSKTDFQGSSKAVTTTYSNFNVFGSPLNISTAASNCPTINITIEYDAYGRLRKRTDAAGTSETGYDLFGRVKSAKSIGGLTASYEYDGFGNLIKETHPTGVINYAQAWDISGNQLYRLDRTEPSAPAQSAWYNAAGQELKARVKGFSGDVFTKKEYNSIGQLTHSYLPGYGNPGSQYTEYVYDELGRVLTETSSIAGTTTYWYGSRSSSVTYPDGTRQVTLLDDSGLLWMVEDQGGSTTNITYAYNSLGLPVTITAAGLTTRIGYDFRGYQRALKDPNLSDSIRYEYDAYGMLRSQKNARGQTTYFTYDAAGRLLTEISPDMNLTYHYVTSGNGKGQLEYIKTGSTELRKIEYNSLGLPWQITEKIDGDPYITKYSYDSYGRLLQKESPSGFKLLHIYNADGYLTALKDGGANTNLWEAVTINAFGQITSSTLGNGLTRKTVYKSGDLTLQSITLNNGSITPPMDEIEYNFIPSSGNLQRRNDKTNVRNEVFGTDALNRLNSMKMNSAAAQSITYYPNGNINTKFDVGTYQYANNNHAVSGITNLAPGYSPPAYSLTHKSFDRPAQITQGNEKIAYEYNPGKQRNVSRYSVNNVVQTTRYYSGSYEKEITGSTTKEFDYICSPEGLAAIAVKTGNTRIMYYAHTDHLGSLRLLSDANKSIASRYYYDAWGKRTLVSGSHITNRGFTMHEHLDDFGLINMNARLYDPVIGRFLSPDPYVQAPDFSQSYNRYSYAGNNPLVYTDPDGELFWLIPVAIGAIMGGYSGYKIAEAKGVTGGNMFWYIAGGAVIGGLAGYAGGAIAGNVASSAIAAGNTAMQSAIAGGMMGGLVSGGINGAGMTALAGGNFSDIMGNMIQGAVTGGFAGAAGAAAFQGMNNLLNKTFEFSSGRLVFEIQPSKYLPTNTLSYMAGSTASQMTANLVNGRNPFKGVDYGFNLGMLYPLAMDGLRYSNNFNTYFAKKSHPNLDIEGVYSRNTTLLPDGTLQLDQEIGVRRYFPESDAFAVETWAVTGKISPSALVAGYERLPSYSYYYSTLIPNYQWHIFSIFNLLSTKK